MKPIAFAAAMSVAAPVLAQDMGPVVDPGIIAQGQATAVIGRNAAERKARRSRPADPETMRTCADGRVKLRNGNRDPRLRRMLALCRQGGY